MAGAETRGKGESSCSPGVRIFPGEQGAELEHRSEKAPMCDCPSEAAQSRKGL